MTDDRQDPRYPVSWPVRLWLSPECSLLGRVVEAGRWGVKVVLLTWVPAAVTTVGEAYRLEMDAPSCDLIVRTGEVRNASIGGIGFVLLEPLPDHVVSHASRGGAPASSATATSTPSLEGRRATLTLQQLSALIHTVVPLMSAVGRASVGDGLLGLVGEALDQGARGDWRGGGRTVTDVQRLCRVAVRMEELPIERFVTIHRVLRAAQEMLAPLTPVRSPVRMA